MNTIPIRPLLTLKLATLAALAFLMLLLNGCHWVGVHGNGKVKTDSRAVSNFTKLETDGAFTINWTPGPASLKITTDSNLLEYIRTDVSDDRLRIEWIKPLKGTRGIKVEVASPSLTRVTLNGAVKLTASNLSGTEFYLDANGATKATLDRDGECDVGGIERREQTGRGIARHAGDGVVDQWRGQSLGERDRGFEGVDLGRGQGDVLREPDGLEGDQRRGQHPEAGLRLSRGGER